MSHKNKLTVGNILPDTGTKPVTSGSDKAAAIQQSFVIDTMVASIETVESVRAGYTLERFTALRDALDTKDTELAELIGLNPEDTDEPLTKSVSNAIARIELVFSDAIRTLHNPLYAAQWLREPNSALQNQRPLDLLDTEPGAQMVKDVLGRIAFGLVG